MDKQTAIRIERIEQRLADRDAMLRDVAFAVAELAAHFHVRSAAAVCRRIAEKLDG